MLKGTSLYKFIPHYVELKINDRRRDWTQPDSPAIPSGPYQLPNRNKPREHSRRRASSKVWGVSVSNIHWHDILLDQDGDGFGSNGDFLSQLLIRYRVCALLVISKSSSPHYSGRTWCPKNQVKKHLTTKSRCSLVPWCAFGVRTTVVQTLSTSEVVNKFPIENCLPGNA